MRARTLLAAVALVAGLQVIPVVAQDTAPARYDDDRGFNPGWLGLLGLVGLYGLRRDHDETTTGTTTPRT